MASFKVFKDKAGDVLHRLDTIKYSVAAPIVITGIYTTLSALTGTDYSQNTTTGVLSLSLAGGCVADAVRYWRHKP
jgi:hypothetical protein